MAEVYLAIGSNLGNRLENLRSALSLLEKQTGRIIKKSAIYETEPWGFVSPNLFLNQVICLETELTLTELAEKTAAVEKQMGRVKKNDGYSDRIIDIDLLLCGNVVMNQQGLIIPHPRLHERNFILQPLNEIAPEAIHPVFNVTISELFMRCRDTKKVFLFIYDDTTKDTP